MQLVPAAGDPGQNPRLPSKADRSQQRAELEVFEHGLLTAVGVQKEMMDSQALGDVLTCALEEEMSLLDYGVARANGSAAKLELVARKVEMMSAIDNRRILRRYGR